MPTPPAPTYTLPFCHVGTPGLREATLLRSQWKPVLEYGGTEAAMQLSGALDLGLGTLTSTHLHAHSSHLMELSCELNN